MKKAFSWLYFKISSKKYRPLQLKIIQSEPNKNQNTLYSVGIKYPNTHQFIKIRTLILNFLSVNFRICMINIMNLYD